MSEHIAVSKWHKQFGWMGEPGRVMSSRIVPGGVVGRAGTPFLKVVAVEGAINDWAAYSGSAEWDDDRVADMGDKLYVEHAAACFPLFNRTKYRP